MPERNPKRHQAMGGKHKIGETGKTGSRKTLERVPQKQSIPLVYSPD
jgi:hypothetical protein